jgi:serine/threonine protein kinase
MGVSIFSCGPSANESEVKTYEYLKSRLQSEMGGDWVLLTNLAFSVTHQLQSDEIDIVAIGPSGVRVIEIKHWTAVWVDSHKDLVKQEADRVTNKARKIGTTLRKYVVDLPYVGGAFLLSQEHSKVKRLAKNEVCGVKFYSLNDWKAALNFNSQTVLSPQQVTILSCALAPKCSVAIDGSMRRLAGYVNLELKSPKEECFHRVYKGIHFARQDRVILHLYDLSASDDKNAETKAEREFKALHRLQLHSWAPRILDSYQEAPGYAGEMFFFTVVDPAAPDLEKRVTDDTWTVINRIEFGRNTIRALMELHNAGTADGPIIHRNLTPRTILVKYDNSPFITGFERTKIPSDISVVSSSLPIEENLVSVAPEVASQGLAAADHRSDVYSLCASLSQLFEGREEDLNQRVLEVLELGLTAQPEHRSSFQDLDTKLSELLGESVPLPEPPPARFWTEDQIVCFRNRDYRIVTRLGSGGVGTTYKVVEIDRLTKDDLGTYVAKIARDSEIGQRVLKTYNLVRSHLRHTGLSTIFEVAQDWQENDFVALMTWIEGASLAEFTGVFTLLAEDQQETSGEALASRWMQVMCQALDVLHRNGLIHGDISPRNMIVSGSDLVLTDYDFVSKIGMPVNDPGTVLYCSPSYQDNCHASPSDDIYALSASFFHVIFEKEPFRYGGELDKKRGLNWEGIEKSEYPLLTEFLDNATHSDPAKRFANVTKALLFFEEQQSKTLQINVQVTDETKTNTRTEGMKVEVKLREQRVDWLHNLLQSYPGSRWGNCETRGLDTFFAAQTYVPTQLEETLIRDIHQRKIRLVIMCGNAGDGKTALLQHLAQQLGLGKHSSSKRILEGQVKDGPFVRMNLDGSASWLGRTADDILDEFLAPFQDGPPNQDIVHLLAINDGRLLEWIKTIEEREGDNYTPLTEELYKLLQQEEVVPDSYIRFISLNQRSLVGGIISKRNQIETGFLELLLNHLYGGDDAAAIWSPCQSCSAKDRCEVFSTARIFGPDSLPMLVETNIRLHARQRLFEALQAVHLRGEMHITVRELRAAMVYILFGIHFCDDYHGEIESPVLAYWDRAFSPDSVARQGELLRELAYFDPALEAHPQIDRHLLSKPVAVSIKKAPHYDQLSLESARRRAFFEWTVENVKEVACDSNALDLARGQHLRQFRNLPLDNDPVEQFEICKRICYGISRLEDLPYQALERVGVVPLRITPRTPTETAFWVEKKLDAFRLEANLPPESEGIERLHRQAYLIFRYRNGKEERLQLGSELFHLLLEMADGYQLGDVSTDDTFAHLSIFVQRLVREDERELLAWNPMQDKQIYKVSTAMCETDDGSQQRMRLRPLMKGEKNESS